MSNIDMVHFQEPQQFGETNYHLNNRYFRDPLIFEDLYLYQLGRMYCKNDTIIDRHIHTDLYELTIVTDGEGEIFTNGIPTAVKRGDIYLSHPCDAHEIRSSAAHSLKFDFVAFFSQHEEFKRELAYITEHYYSPYTRVFRDERIGQMIGDAIAELAGDRPYARELLAALLRQIVIRVIRGFRKLPPDKHRDTVTSAEVLCYKLMNYIDTHIYSMKNLEELAAITDYSYGYLSALFKKTTSGTLAHYYREKKLVVAQLLITEQRFTITEIADMLNYASVYSFSKAFHKRFGLSPRAYREEKSNNKERMHNDPYDESAPAAVRDDRERAKNL